MGGTNIRESLELIPEMQLLFCTNAGKEKTLGERDVSNARFKRTGYDTKFIVVGYKDSDPIYRVFTDMMRGYHWEQLRRFCARYLSDIEDILIEVQREDRIVSARFNTERYPELTANGGKVLVKPGSFRMYDRSGLGRFEREIVEPISERYIQEHLPKIQRQNVQFR